MQAHGIERRWRMTWLAVVALAVYGSLYPFAWRASPLPWQSLLIVPRHISRSDILGNLLLFAPYGFCGLLALRQPRLAAALGVLVSGVLLALTLQVAQLWSLARTAALYDAGWNALGVLVGILAARGMSGWFAGRGPKHVSDARLAAALVVIAWVGSELLPWVPSLDWQHAKDNLRPLLGGLSAWSGLTALGVGLRALLAGEALGVVLGTAGLLMLLPLCGVLLAGKVLVVGQALNASIVIGVLTGAGVSLASQLLAPGPRRLTLILLLLVGIGALALLPLDPYAPRLAADWVPFAGLLRGNMLLNAQALAGRIFIYAGLLWLLRAEGIRPLPASVGLAVWVAVLELVQLALPGQRADFTEPLWALLCGWAWSLLPTTAAAGAVTPPAAARQVPAPARSEPSGGGACVARTLLLATALTLGLAGLLRLPGLPYNVSELFRSDGSLPVLFVFSLAILWTGASAAWIGGALAAGRRAWLFFPVAVLVAAVVSLRLLYASVTGESILDIAGSNDLYRAVTTDNVWGARADELFTNIGRGPVAFLERPIRYAALVGPLWFFLAFALAISRGLRGLGVLAVLLAAVPWLWLCKVIAFDGASTDNLGELIAREGRWGLGGGGYLYGLLALVCVSAALLAHRWRSPLAALAAWVLVAAGVPLGWWLLTHGLEPNIHKYDRVFSGVQFLLGPDRDQKLAQIVLFWRWAAVHLGLVAALATGAWAAAPLARKTVPRSRPEHGPATLESDQDTSGRLAA